MKRGSAQGVGVLEAEGVKGFPDLTGDIKLDLERKLSELKDEKQKKGISGRGHGMAWAKAGRYTKGNGDGNEACSW